MTLRYLLLTPLRFPFPFLPLPSLAAYMTLGCIMGAFWCWGSWLLPNRWPFRLWPPTIPMNSWEWYVSIVAMTIGSLIGVVGDHNLRDLGTAVAWVGSGLLLMLCLHLISRVQKQKPSGPDER